MASDDGLEGANRQFDYDEWLESVEGETITVDAPDGFPKIPKCYYIPSWSKPHREFYCGDCDRMRFPVFVEIYPPKRRCPVCGNEPGIVELGTDGTLTDVRPNDI